MKTLKKELSYAGQIGNVSTTRRLPPCRAPLGRHARHHRQPTQQAAPGWRATQRTLWLRALARWPRPTPDTQATQPAVGLCRCAPCAGSPTHTGVAPRRPAFLRTAYAASSRCTLDQDRGEQIRVCAQHSLSPAIPDSVRDFPLVSGSALPAVWNSSYFVESRIRCSNYT